jgi:hypothetical protein
VRPKQVIQWPNCVTGRRRRRRKGIFALKHQAMKTHGDTGNAPRILNLGTIWRWMVSFTVRPLYPQHYWIGCWVDSNISKELVVKRRKFVIIKCVTWFTLQFPSYDAVSNIHSLLLFSDSGGKIWPSNGLYLDNPTSEYWSLTHSTSF